MLNQQCAILTVIDSYIQPLLIHVLSTDKLGVCCKTIEIDSMSSSCGKVQGDRFKLSIPYAKQNLTWNVLFDSQCPEMGPDFIFNDNTFLADMDVDALSAKVPSLAKWNPNDENALLNVLRELLSCYKQHQVQLLQKQARLQLEYNMLMNSGEVKTEDVEVILLPSSSKPMEARFLISLSVDVSQLEIRTCKSESDIAMLLVTFSGTDWSRITPQLYFSKSLEESLSGTGELHLPHFPSDTYLLRYIPKVKKYIAGKVNSVVQSLKRRRDYIAACSFIHHKCLLEYDSINCKYVTFLVCVDDFFACVHIRFPFGFPQEPPLVELRSIYHLTQRTAYSERLKYPYDVSWSPKFMVERLCQTIYSYLQTFKFNSIKNCSGNQS
ncbi:BRISC and BRCA1-A complex member 2 [Bombus vancouverensis nearcticus]|uniref:BRISC and BRCA1-A complex member 2 n=1 Tax=Bombus vancouverensis nearcticus TaxID=2705178 RepID=UPI00402BADAB